MKCQQNLVIFMIHYNWTLQIGAVRKPHLPGDESVYLFFMIHYNWTLQIGEVRKPRLPGGESVYLFFMIHYKQQRLAVVLLYLLRE